MCQFLYLFERPLQQFCTTVQTVINSVRRTISDGDEAELLHRRRLASKSAGWLYKFVGKIRRRCLKSIGSIAFNQCSWRRSGRTATYRGHQPNSTLKAMINIHCENCQYKYVYAYVLGNVNKMKIQWGENSEYWRRCVDRVEMRVQLKQEAATNESNCATQQPGRVENTCIVTGTQSARWTDVTTQRNVARSYAQRVTGLLLTRISAYSFMQAEWYKWTRSQVAAR